ncbi:MAG: hypothetical protein ACRCS3_00200 [Paracoccaceae bacterium]
MDDLKQRIHVNEFAAHMALFGAAPVWQHLFGKQVAEHNLIAIQTRMLSGPEPFTVQQVEQGVRTNLGDDAVGWMWNVFVSTTEPRATEQQAVLTAFVRPTVAPAHDPTACQSLAQALTKDRIAALTALEALLANLALQSGDPRDQRFVAALSGLVLQDMPCLRLTDSIYLSILSSAVPMAGVGRGC